MQTVFSYGKQKANTTICVLVLIAATSNVYADVLFDETFSGTGPYTASGGPSGFENPSWAVTGNAGAFSTNGFNEYVYSVTNPNQNSQAGLLRNISNDSIEILAEFSNPQFVDTGFVGISISDFPDFVGLNVFKASDGNHYANYGAQVNAQIFSGDALNLGAAIDRFTLRAIYQPDLNYGGSRFDFWIDINESNTFQYLGNVDGSVYTSGPSGRTLLVGNTYITGAVTSEFDRLTISSIPEPTTAVLFTIAVMGMAIGTRRHRQ